jgi:CheY-like chemotaxis protein
MVVLYVDDDIEDQEIFCEAIKVIDSSIDCLRANDGQQAIDILSKRTQLPDYILTDINMPFLDGKGLLRYLKTHSRYKATR